MNEYVSARIALLDNQLVDAGRRPIGRVDDLELALENGTLRVDSILIGAQALGERLGGTIGRGMAALAARFRPRTDPPGPARKDDLRVVGLVVGDGFLADAAVAWGFAEGRARGPWPLRKLTARAVRRITFVPFERVARWGHGKVVLADGLSRAYRER
jgi:hypothetical protein